MADKKTSSTNQKDQTAEKSIKVFSRNIFSLGKFFIFVLVSGFRDWIKDDPSAEYPAEANRYHIYFAYSCPWVNIH